MENNKINNDELTLRDQFAMAALTGLFSGQLQHRHDYFNFATIAYEYADAMMEARK